MSIKHKDRLKLLALVAFRLGGSWQYNSLLSEGSHYYWLSNQEGLYIRIFTAYRENLPQWELCIKNKRFHSDFESILTIGCSLDKSPNSIVSDIKSRLLSESDTARETIQKNRNARQERQALIDSRKFVIEAIKKSTNLEQTHHHRHNDYSVLSYLDCETKIGYLTHRHDKIDDFDLRLYNLNAEQIIKIMQIIKQG